MSGKAKTKKTAGKKAEMKAEPPSHASATPARVARLGAVIIPLAAAGFFAVRWAREHAKAS